MKSNSKILIISNGHGEDAVAAQLIRGLAVKFPAPELAITALPLSGDGAAFKALQAQGIALEIAGPARALPSGGFSLRNLRDLIPDLRAGFLGNLRSIKAVLSDFKGKIDLVVAVGDILPVYAGTIVKAPIVLVGVNKTDYYRTWYSRYWWLEKLLLKKVKAIFTRDQFTANNLVSQGFPAEFLGNPLMDTLDEGKFKPREANVIGFLPGTRKDAKINLEDFEKIAVALKRSRPHLRFLVASSESASNHFEPASFEEVITRSQMVIGLSGTGNEQAVGMNTPVIAFPGRGSQFTLKFALAQKELLGKGLALVLRSQVPSTALEYLNAEGSLRHDIKAAVEQVGNERMHRGHACERIIATL